ncbi:DUF7527 domain-containing protein [Halosimplex salinum]|uniref:DUF7527 domain-containing protein n=1 Tax=Halosimplex salinum TaxID=1710538 RepID=UPI000F470F82|nr:hypothetical protein [Halosimplex salinum]
MTTRAVEQFDEWESSPFRDGYRGLHDLADEEFSGIVTAGGAKLCMLNGTAVGILGGTIDDFEDASGTAYRAPSPALPLLALMQERNDEVRAKYYSEDTPLSEVDGTLSDGGFTGFIELSENVLSGDYYVVYHRGRSMAVAWVGNSGQLLTDDEAFDQADDEVGIFQVRPAELEPVEIPDADSGEDESAAGASAAGTGADAADASDDPSPDAGEPDDDPAPTTDEDDGEPATGRSDSTPAADATGAEPAEDTTPGPDAVSDETAAGAGTDTTGTDTETTADRSTAADRSADASDRSANASTTGANRTGDRTAESGRSDRDGAGTATGDRATGARNDTAERREPATDRSGADDRGSDTDVDRSAGATGSTGSDRSERTERRTGADETDDARASRERTTERRDRDRTEGRRDGAARRSEADTAQDDGRVRERDSNSTSTDAPAEPSTDARTDSASEPDRGRTDRRESTDQAGAADRAPDSGGRTEETTSSGGSAGGAGATGSPAQLETYSIPSLDPGRTSSPRADEASETADDSGGRESVDSAVSAATEGPAEATPDRSSESSGHRQDERSAGRDEPAGNGAADARTERSTTEPRSEPAGSDKSDARVADLEAELADRETEIRDLEAELAAAESERDDLRAQLDDVRAERDDLQARIERVESDRDQLRTERDAMEEEVADLQEEVNRLETQIDDIEAEFGAAVDADQRLSPGEALDQTNLFVRYESKGQATLETAHAGEAGRQDVGENLGLEYHTQFDSENASVGGRPFDEFLRETIQFQFVTWVINDLLYEIRDTGKVAELQDLYDAIPKIDRAELNGVVATEYTEDGQERRSQESFDVVMRDRMGNALLTANMNDSRQAASESMMSSLVTASSHVGESTETLGASFLVTSSFFEPEALETAAEATSGGLLSRDKRASFVKLTRKQGYHLCLVEAREEKFHLAVPEL